MITSRPTSSHGSFTIPSLDGIRAVAVGIVFIGHAPIVPTWWPGHVGVTIFFFLSGFLITTLMRREFDRNRKIELGKFYLRRLLRITPPALFTVLLCSWIGYYGLLNSSMNGWGILATALNYTNYYMAYVNGHGGLPPESSMLWSLAVEEHYYLVYPVLMILLLKLRIPYNQIGTILLLAALCAPLWRLYLQLNGANFYRLYTSSDTRYDGLLIGSAMALAWNPSLGDKAPLGFESKTMGRITPIALLIFAYASVKLTQYRLTFVDTLLYACLIPIFWTIIAYPSAWLGTILNGRIVAHIGVLSYSLYLNHRLVLGLCNKYIQPSILADLAALFLSLLLAQGMWLVIERPAAGLRRKLESNAIKKSSYSTVRSSETT